jgi:hypothetical protein
LPAIIFAVGQGVAAIWFVAFMLFLTWVAMCYMAATGVWCSVSSRSSWRSLVSTLATGYGHLLAILTLVAMASIASSCISLALAWAIAFYLPIGSSRDALALAFCSIGVLFMAWRLYRASQIKLSSARSCVDSEEREGKTFSRVLTRALRKHYQRRERTPGTVTRAVGQDR